MLTKSVLMVSAITLVSVSLLWGQGGGTVKKQQGFTDCDLDLRPSQQKEVQIYWEEEPAAPNVMRFRLWAPADDLIHIEFPDGSDGLYLKQGWGNTVTFVYTASSPPKLMMEICNEADPGNCPTANFKTMEVEIAGSYDQYGALDPDPLHREARDDAQGREQVYIYGWNLGLEVHFLLRRG